MSTESPQSPGRPPQDVQARVKYLLAHVWQGRQREMARAIGVSQGLISKVVNGQQLPGPRLMRALANHPGINADWLIAGTGQPIPFPERGSLPIAVGVLPGPPLEYPHLLSGSRHHVADALNRPTRYWVALVGNSPLLREPVLRLAAGDLLLMDADTAWTGRPELSDGKLCGVRLPARPEPEYHIGRVLTLQSGLAVQLFGGSFLGPMSSPSSAKRDPQGCTPSPPLRRKIRRLDDEETKARKSEKVKEQAQTKARVGLPINREDIVAVQVYMVRPETLPV